MLGMALCLLITSNPGKAADGKDVRATIDKLAQTAARDPANLPREAAKAAQSMEEIEEMMNLFRKRTKSGKGGFGVGPTPTGMPDDGIEARLINLGKKPLDKEQIAREAPALLQMAHRTMAIAQVALSKAPVKKEGNKDPRDWKEYAGRMIKSTQELTRAIEAQDPADLKKAAAGVNTACTNCHTKFRD